MSTLINIAGTPIQFPTSAQSPNWAQAVTDFAKAVEGALSSYVGPYDIPPQVLNIDASNPASNIDLPNLAFPTSTVRSAFIRYAVFRQTDTVTVAESGNLQVVYNPANPVNNKWEIARDYVGDASVTFTISDIGQVKYSTATIAGSSHTGQITYVAQSILQSS